MIQLNIHEAKTHLSKYLDRLAAGETIILCKRNVPIAEIKGIRAKKGKRRPLPQDKGKIVLGKEFFDPMPDEFLAYFRGEKD